MVTTQYATQRPAPHPKGCNQRRNPESAAATNGTPTPKWHSDGDIGNIDTPKIESQMYKITSRYVVVATTVMAVCLTIQVMPNPPPMVVDHRGSNVGPPPSRLHHFLSSWPIEFGTFFVGIATGMHLLTSVVGMFGWRQWLTAICVPTLAFTAWYAYSVRYLNHHPGSLGEWGHVQLGLIGFSIGFALVTLAVMLLSLMVNRSDFATPDRPEASFPEENAK